MKATHGGVLLFSDQGFNESIGERTVRQTDRKKVWLYLAAFLTTKQSYKVIK